MCGNDKNNIPLHIAVIMDGNGRWAEQRGKNRVEGHIMGVRRVEEIVKEASDLGVKYLTLYTFSKENWNRPDQEVSGIMNLLAQTIIEQIEPMRQQGVKLSFIGDLSELHPSLQDTIKEANAIEPQELKINLVIALNYSSRWEITEAVKQICSEMGEKFDQDTKYGSATERQQLIEQTISQETVSSHLNTSFMPDPDLMIRSGGEKRVSNFMLWQLSYSELYFCDTLWPDFGAKDFSEAIEYYKQRKRRFGAL